MVQEISSRNIAEEDLRLRAQRVRFDDLYRRELFLAGVDPNEMRFRRAACFDVGYSAAAGVESCWSSAFTIAAKPDNGLKLAATPVRPERQQLTPGVGRRDRGTEKGS